MKAQAKQTAVAVSAEVMEARRVLIMEMFERVKESLTPAPDRDSEIGRMNRLLATLRLGIATFEKDPGVPNAEREIRRIRKHMNEFEEYRQMLIERRK